MNYIRRTLEVTIKQTIKEFPVIVLSGPRQSGKTTLLKHLFEKQFNYISLELPDIQSAAIRDPRGFLDFYSPPVIFDEIQYAPSLLPYIKERVDTYRDRAGQYILTGSQNILLNQEVTESLAGRAAMLRLLPLSYREMTGVPQALLPWEEGAKPLKKGLSYKDLGGSFLRGGYPELSANKERQHMLWHASYVQTYLERDVRSIRQIGDLNQFQIFLRALAARSAQLLNLSELSRDLGLAVNTIKSWLSVLEATFQIIILRPYFVNVGKRLVKTPKVYFGDVGTLCYLVGLKDADHALAGPMGGTLMETIVVNEVVRTLTHQGKEGSLYFWRTSTGQEVDLIIDTGSKLVPIEVKLSTTPNLNMVKGIEAFRKIFGERTTKGYLVHPGTTKLPLGPDTIAWPFSEF
ncbi:MAG: GTP-binding protein [Desulfobacca sp.]|nr:GTP-binding protein [Desulfobacca sp.]